MILLFTFFTLSFPTFPAIENPLSKFSKEWDDPKYLICNTAKDAAYLTQKEKEVIYILNLARTSPSLFLHSVVKKYPAYAARQSIGSTSYYKSLLVFLETQSSLPLLSPNKELFESAFCHASSSGERGYEGHHRQTANCKKLERFQGECCYYGPDDPLAIVVDLLIDDGVPSLGHRKILFDRFATIGLSIQPHRNYQWNTVLDFGF